MQRQTICQKEIITQQLVKYNQVQQSGWRYYTSYVPILTDMTVLYDYNIAMYIYTNPLILINVRQHL